MILFNDFETCTQNNGDISQWFKPTRGTYQGCGISPFLYLCCGEVKAHLLKENEQIKGLSTCHIKTLLAQFADDTNLFLRFEKVTLEALVHVLQIVEKHIGLGLTMIRLVSTESGH